MRSPEVVRAIPALVEEGILDPAIAVTPLRIARGELMSVRGELRAVLYFGVLVAMAGVSILVKENLDRIGPVAIAVALGMAAAAVLGWALRRSPPFRWERVESPDWSFDYLLLLGILLLGAELAFVESRFTALGPDWGLHLLLMSLVTAALALRCDSRISWSLALSTFAAWRGVAAARVGSELLGEHATTMRWNLALCGAVFLGLGYVLWRFGRKAHFEPLTTFAGALALLLAFGLSAIGASGPWVAWALAFLALASGFGIVALRLRRFGLFALAAVAAYAAVTRLALTLFSDTFLGCFWFSGSSVAMIVVLFLVQRRFRVTVDEEPA